MVHVYTVEAREMGAWRAFERASSGLESPLSAAALSGRVNLGSLLLLKCGPPRGGAAIVSLPDDRAPSTNVDPGSGIHAVNSQHFSAQPLFESASAMLATRFSQPPIAEPAYDMRSVRPCRRDLEGSVVQRVVDRDAWVAMQGELLLICNEAKERRRRAYPHDLGCTDSSKPLSMEYIVDRIDTDDPVWGYVVRDVDTGAMQGFITLTTFTTWHHSFRWDSLCAEAGLRELHDTEDVKLDTPEEAALAEWHASRKLDKDGALSRALEAELRDGDPAAAGGGTIWPHVAELSLIGALGCGRFLLQLVIDELENGAGADDHDYRFVVLQATEVQGC